MKFHRFKGFRQYSIILERFNILVGPNNCGKSTILGAFRILAEAMRKARAKSPDLIPGPGGPTIGYSIDLSNIPVAAENIFYDYDTSEPATVVFRLSNHNEMLLFFPDVGSCYLICNTTGRPVRSPAQFRQQYNAPIGFVPILGPVEHNEQLFQKEAARLALMTYRAARNFRNIWHHYPEEFDEFRSLVKATWPGMDIERPEVDYSGSPPRLHMFCPEERIPREIFWAGFGFQVWCQMLTYIIRGRDSSLFLIDEPDIYLHSDLQRQLLNILRSLGPDILIATHSTEIISEAEPDNLLVVNRRSLSPKRISDPGQLQKVFQALGSNLNPVLTQLAKTKRALFVEGYDFQVLSSFARKLGNTRVASRGDFAVVPAEGFNANKVRDFKQGMEMTLGASILAGVIFDRDYRCDAECAAIKKEIEKRGFLFAKIHKRKEIENFLLHPGALSRAIKTRLTERNKRAGKAVDFEEDVLNILQSITGTMRHAVEARYLEKRKPFEKTARPGFADETIMERLMKEYDEAWSSIERRLEMVPGKETLGALNAYLQTNYGITISPILIIESFRSGEVDPEMVQLVKAVDNLAQWKTD